MAALEEGFGLCKILLLPLVLVLAMVTTSLLLETLSPQIHRVDMFQDNSGPSSLHQTTLILVGSSWTWRE
jgi:hypothetical protein